MHITFLKGAATFKTSEAQSSFHQNCFLRLKMHQIYFWPGLHHGPRWESLLRRSLILRNRLEREIPPSRYALHSTPAGPLPLPGLPSLKNFLWSPMSTDAVICHSGGMQHLTQFDVGRGCYTLEGGLCNMSKENGRPCFADRFNSHFVTFMFAVMLWQ